MGIAAIGLAIGTLVYSGLMSRYTPPKQEQSESRVSEHPQRTYPERLWYHGKKNVSTAYDKVSGFLFEEEEPEKQDSYIGKE